MTEAELLEAIAKSALERITSIYGVNKTIPPVIGKLSALTELDLRNKQITEIPEAIALNPLLFTLGLTQEQF